MDIQAFQLVGATLALAGLCYVAVCSLVAHRFTRSRRTPPQAQQRHPSLDDRQVHFPARDGRARIDAWYLAAKPRRGAVVLVHGKDACRGDELKSPTFALVRTLLDAGLSVLCIDLRGHGTSSNARLSYGWHERHDVLGAVDYLIERGYTPGRIGVLGASMGGAAALLAAAQERAIGAVVTDSAFADFHQMIHRQYTKLARLPHCFLPGALVIGRLFMGVEVRRVRPLDHMAQLRGRPVLLIHAEGDRFVPADDASALARAAGAECWRTESDGHIGSYRHLPRAYTERVVAFFATHLDPNTPPPRQPHAGPVPAVPCDAAGAVHAGMSLAG